MKGVTILKDSNIKLSKISIHTPVKGVTSCALFITVSIQSNFNPHSREGSDLTLGAVKVKNKKISIHTPVKGVTLCTLELTTGQYIFNPHSREGSDGV